MNGISTDSIMAIRSAILQKNAALRDVSATPGGAQVDDVAATFGAEAEILADHDPARAKPAHQHAAPGGKRRLPPDAKRRGGLCDPGFDLGRRMLFERSDGLGRSRIDRCDGHGGSFLLSARDHPFEQRHPLVELVVGDHERHQGADDVAGGSGREEQ